MPRRRQSLHPGASRTAAAVWTGLVFFIAGHTDAFSPPLALPVAQNPPAIINRGHFAHSEHDFELNGETSAALLNDGSIPLAPPLSFEKYLTLQEKRVPVAIRYSGQSGLRPFFLTVAKWIKKRNPDVVVEKLILPSVDGDDLESSTFEVLVDGKVVVGKAATKWQGFRRQSMGSSSGGGSSGGTVSTRDLAGGLSIYVSLEEVDLALAKARRRRRPNSTVYSQSETENQSAQAVRLEILREQSSATLNDETGPWND